MSGDLAFVLGEFSAPIPEMVVECGGKSYGVVAMHPGLSSRLKRPGDTGLPDMDFGMTPFGKFRCGVAGTVSFEDPSVGGVPAAVTRWLAHGERGLSADAICRALYGVPGVISGYEHWPYPHDPDDFRRCLLFLDNCPDGRDSLSAMADKSPQWKALIDHWDAIEALMRQEAPTGTCPRSYELISELARDANQTEAI